MSTRDSLLAMLWEMFKASHEDSVTLRVPQGIAILQTNGRHLLIRVDEAVLEAVR